MTCNTYHGVKEKSYLLKLKEIYIKIPRKWEIFIFILGAFLLYTWQPVDMSHVDIDQYRRKKFIGKMGIPIEEHDAMGTRKNALGLL